MTDLRKAAEMALAKLDHLWEIAVDERMNTDVLPEIKALRQALAQPEREQYVTRVVAMHEDGTYTTEQIPLPKREWVGLTDEVIWDIKMKGRDLECVSRSALMRFAREVSNQLKEKNT